MIVIGCLSLIILPLIGLAVGGYIGGLNAAIWSAVIGFVLAGSVKPNVPLCWRAG